MRATLVPKGHIDVSTGAGKWPPVIGLAFMLMITVLCWSGLIVAGKVLLSTLVD